MSNFIELKSHLTIVPDGNGVDANILFEDLNKIVSDTKRRIGWERMPRHFMPQTVINRTSGGYVSPTMLKSFVNCPSEYLYSMLVREDHQAATYIGTSFHTVVQRFYELENDMRDRKHFDQIVQTVIGEDEITGSGLNNFMIYCEGFFSAPDYIKGPNGESLPMDHKSITNKLEYFVKDKFSPMGVNLNINPADPDLPSLTTYTLMDRVDFRTIGNEEKMFIIDYKTGMGNARSQNLGQNGYLPQMIFYKWAAESVFNMPVEDVYLMLPGANDQDHKWVKMNVHSLVEQSKVIDDVIGQLQNIQYIHDSKIFPTEITNFKNQYPMKRPHMDYSIHDELKQPAGTNLPIEVKIDERKFLESALESEMISSLPDNVESIKDWVKLSQENNHKFEDESILNDENKIIKQQSIQFEDLAGDDTDDEDEDW